LTEFFGARYNLGLLSVATPLILGTKDHILIEDPELKADVEAHKDNLAARN
jgi:hypothetical protein